MKKYKMKNTKNRVTHFEIQADNVDRAKKFYQNIFGWKIDQAMKKDKDGMDYWLIMTGDPKTPGIDGGLYERPMVEIERNYLFDCTIEVADIDEAIKMVRENGGIIIKEKMEIPKIGWFAGAKDTEGNKFGLMQSIAMDNNGKNKKNKGYAQHDFAKSKYEKILSKGNF